MMRVSAVLVMAILLGACGTPAPVPDDHYYRLADSQIRVNLESPAIPGRLLAETPEAAGVRRDRKMLYSNDSAHLRFQQYHYHHWEDALPYLLHRRLTEQLQTAGIASDVVDRPGPGVMFRLGSRIDRFERLISGSGHSVVVSIDFVLTPNDDRDAVLMRRTLEARQAASDDSMESTVVAFSAAMDQVGRQLLDEMQAIDF